MVLFILCLFSIFLSGISAQTDQAKMLYEEGIKQTKDAKDEVSFKKGVELVTQAAEQGYGEAEYMMALYVNTGLVEGDCPTIINWYKRAMAHGLKEAAVPLGLLQVDHSCELDDNLQLAVDGLVALSDKDNIEAIAILAALSYQEGKEDLMDQSMGRLEKLADGNKREAKYYLGSWYLDDFHLGIDKQVTKAMKYLQDAAAGGEVRAQKRLGEIYLYGDYGEKDLDKGFNYYEEVAKSGDVEAEFYVGALYYEFARHDSDYKKAFYWLTKASEKGHKHATFYLGQMYSFGKGVKKDEKKAEEFIEDSMR